MISPYERIVQLLQAVLPGLEDILNEMADAGGWLTFSDKFATLCISASLQWWTFYEDERKLRSLTPLMFASEEEARAIDEPGRVDEFINDLAQIAKELDSLETPTADQLSAYAEEFSTATEDERRELVKTTLLLALGTLTATSNYLSLMIHGRTLCRLVEDSRNGDDDAFCRAVQIDRTVLNLPYFRERMIRAQLCNDPDFLSHLAYRLKTPILSSKIKHPKLWLTFAILDDEGLLSTLPHKDILDICQAVGVYESDDVDNLRKRLDDYRSAQRTPNNF